MKAFQFGRLVGLVLLVAIAEPATASAAESGNWYGAVAGSISLRDDASGTIANAPVPGRTVVTENPFEIGGGGQAALGRRFGRYRLELEGGYIRDSQDRYISLTPPTGSIVADVTETTWRGMVNAYVDFPAKLATLAKPVELYLGGGLGYAHTDLKFIGPRAPFPTEPPRLLIDDSDGRFAYQAMAGLAVPVARRLKATVQYRWFGTDQFNGHDTRGQPITREMQGSNVDVGLRLSF